MKTESHYFSHNQRLAFICLDRNEFNPTMFFILILNAETKCSRIHTDFAHTHTHTLISHTHTQDYYLLHFIHLDTLRKYKSTK